MTVVMDQQDNRAEFRAALNAEAIEAAWLLKLDFLSGAMYLSDWNVPLEIDGQTWLGSGQLASIEELSDGTSASPPVQYGLGIPLEHLSEEQKREAFRVPALMTDEADWSERIATLYQQIMKQGAPVGVPLAMHVGKMAKPRVSISRVEISLTIQSESILIRKRTPAAGSLTDADQKARYPTDRGLELASSAVSEPVDWLNS